MNRSEVTCCPAGVGRGEPEKRKPWKIAVSLFISRV
jgi:hypothetical protein